MKAFKIIRNPEAFHLLGDETRRRIIYLLRAKEMTVSQLAAELNLTPQAIYHHIHKMREADLVEVAREERVDHFIETYYRATAEVFNLSHGEGKSQAYAEAKTREAVQALAKAGFHVRVDPDTISRLVALEKRMAELGDKEGISEKIEQLDDVDFIVRQETAHYAQLLTIGEKEFREYLDLIREHRKLVQSLIEPAKAVVSKA